MQRVDDLFEFGGAHVHLGRDLGNLLGLLGKELVQRRIQEAHRHRPAFENLVHLLKVALLIGKKFGEGGFALFDGTRHDHFAHRSDTGAFKEHMLGAAQADAFGAELDGLSRVARVVGIGADLEGPSGVRPGHKPAEVTADGRLFRGDGFAVDLAGRTVQRNIIAFMVAFAAELEILLVGAHLDFSATRHAAGSHAAGNDGRMGRHPAADGQDTLRDSHAFDVFGRGFQPDKDDLFAALGPLDGVFGGEYDPAARGARGRGKPCPDNPCCLKRLLFELRVKQGVQLLGLDSQDRFFLVDHAFVDEVDGNFQSRGGGAFAVSCLEHIKFAVFDGELHILHIAVVVLKRGRDLLELVVNRGHIFLEFADFARRTDTGDDVLALGVDKILAEKRFLARGGVSGKSDARAGVVVEVAENHRLYIDGGAPGIGDVVHPAVGVGAGVVPGAENRLDGFHHLGLGVVREIMVHIGLVERLELRDHFLHVFGGKVDVLLDGAFLFHLVDDDLELFFGQAHHDVGKHLDETAEGVVDKALKTFVGVCGNQACRDGVVHAEVEDGIHHAGHGSARA